jgi:hypothetical protein
MERGVPNLEKKKKKRELKGGRENVVRIAITLKGGKLGE